MMVMMAMAVMWSLLLALINYTGNWTVVSFLESAPVMMGVVERGVGMWGRFLVWCGREGVISG